MSDTVSEVSSRAPIRVAASATSRADRAAVFALLKDLSTWPKWANFESAVLERAGTDEPYGVGAIRALRSKVGLAREEVVELVPDRSMGYTLLSGFPLDGYRGDVVLEDLPGGGTSISWSSAFYARQPWLGWFWKAALKNVLQTIATRLAKAAESP